MDRIQMLLDNFEGYEPRLEIGPDGRLKLTITLDVGPIEESEDILAVS